MNCRMEIYSCQLQKEAARLNLPAKAGIRAPVRRTSSAFVLQAKACRQGRGVVEYRL